MKALFIKDLRQLWRTFRLPALLLAGLFFALLDPIGAKYMPQIMDKLLSGSEGITFILPELGPADALISFFGNLSQIGTFIIILTAMGAVANERERGISAWVLTRPVGRLPYLWSKWAAYSAGIILFVGSSTLLALLYTTTLLGPAPLFPAIWGAVFMILYLELILTLTIGASTLMRSQMAAAGIALAFLVLIWLPQLFLDQTAVGKWLPYRLSFLLAGLLKGNIGPTDFIPALPATLLLTAAAFIAASLGFRRAEL